MTFVLVLMILEKIARGIIIGTVNCKCTYANWESTFDAILIFHEILISFDLTLSHRMIAHSIPWILLVVFNWSLTSAECIYALKGRQNQNQSFIIVHFVSLLDFETQDLAPSNSPMTWSNYQSHTDRAYI